MNEQELREAARRAIANGADPRLVNARLSEMLDALQPQEAQEAQELAVAASDPRAGSSLSPLVGGAADMGRMAMQALSGGFADEMLGDRDRVQALRNSNPGASLASEAAAALVPAAPILRRGGLAAGAGAGALAGGITAMGENDGSFLDRLAAAPMGVAVGAALGAAVPGVGAMLSRRGQPARVAGELEKLSGVKRTDRRVRREESRGIARKAREGYQAVSETHPRVIDEDLTALLNDFFENSGPDARSAVRRIEDRNAPTIEELQQARTALRKKKRMAEADQLTELMNRVPGFESADDLYFTAHSARRALDQGKKMVNANADDIAETLEKLSPDQQFMFRTGQVTELLEQIGKRDDKATGTLKRMMGAGPAYRETLRTMFPTERAFNEFMDVLARERRVDVIAAQAKRWLPWLGGGAVVASN